MLEERNLLQYTKEKLETLINNIKDDKEKEKCRLNEKKCKSLIVQRIADTQLEYIKDKTTAKEILDTLKGIFERKSIASQLYLRRKLLGMKCDNASNLEQHLLEFDKIVRNLKSTGAKMDEIDIVCHLLMTLPSSFDPVITALETLKQEELTIEFVKGRLLDEETKQKNRDRLNDESHMENVAMSSKAFKFKCYNCGKIGHKRSECRSKFVPQNKYYQHANTTERDDEETVTFISSITCENKSKISNENQLKWIIDSGASDHMVKYEHYFSEVKSLNQPIKINIAKDGASLLATKIGNIEGKIIVNGNEIKCKVVNVLFVPNLNANLFSVRKMEQLGMKVIFEKGSVKIYNGNTIVGLGSRNDKLYEMNMEIQEYAGISQRGDDLDIWHKRLGHLNYVSVIKLIRNAMVTGIAKLNDSSHGLCESCIEGKQSRLPFNNTNDIRTSRPLELIHSDVCGPITPSSWDKKNYFVTFIDNYTHFVRIYLLTNKNEVFKSFKEYEAVVTAQFGTKISRLRCDNGGEFSSNEFKIFCKSKGIQLEYTVPYSPQQNGVAERMNRTLMEKARTMILDSKLDKCFWNEAILTAAYLTNRSPTASLNDVTPAEKWYGNKPNISKLRTFGCIAYSHIPKEHRSKLDCKTDKNIFVGYTANGYRLWNISSRKIVIARDVIFDEKSNIKDYQQIPKLDGFYETDESSMEDNNSKSSNVEANENTELNEIIEDDPLEKIRKSQRTIKAPAWQEDYDTSSNLVFALNAENFIEDIPNNIEQLKERDDWKSWKVALHEEINSLNKNKTWTLTKLPEGKKTIDCKWVFKIKRKGNNEIESYKARLVAKGYLQQKGFDYTETYAPVAKLTSLRIILAIANQEKLLIHQMDVKTAFLNGILEEEIYMNQPEGFIDNFICS